MSNNNNEKTSSWEWSDIYTTISNTTKKIVSNEKVQEAGKSVMEKVKKSDIPEKTLKLSVEQTKKGI
jgi:hypothetical protein